MTDAAMILDTQDIVVEEVFPHAPETIWKTLTTGDLIGRWLMKPTGFEPVKGARFTFQTTPAGAWDGVIQCQVLEVTPNGTLRSLPGKADTREMSATAHGWTLSSRSPFPGLKNGTRPSPGPLRLRAPEQRNCVQEHGRRLEEGCPKDRRHGWGTGLFEKPH